VGFGPPLAQSKGSTACTIVGLADDLGDAANVAGGDHLGLDARTIADLALASAATIPS
jgi:hypothetical protein